MSFEHADWNLNVGQNESILAHAMHGFIHNQF